MLGAVQPLDALDFDHVGAGAADLRAHLDQHSREILHLGLARRIFDTVCPRASTAAIMMFSVAPTEGLSSQMRAPGQLLGVRLDVAVAQLDARAERANSRDVQIDGTRTDRASAGSGDPARLARASSGPSTKNDARIVLTSSYGASCEVTFSACSSS